MIGWLAVAAAVAVAGTLAGWACIAAMIARGGLDLDRPGDRRLLALASLVTLATALALP